jgi:hypothetical protein
MQKIWIATLESEKFTFEAYADTEAVAFYALNAVLKRHAAQVGIGIDWHTEYTQNTRMVEIGKAYRDGQEI